MKKILSLFFCLLIFLTGCVRYDVGINFAQVNSGTIVQHLKLDQQLTNFSQTSSNSWLKSIENRAIQLQGKTKRISDEEIVVTIPFHNAQDLVSKFNQFFNPSELNTKKQNQEFTDLLDLKAEMFIHQSNMLFLERNVLNISVDLTPLGVISDEGNVIISPGKLIDLELELNFPWGAKSINQSLPSESEDLPSNLSTKYLAWKLESGRLNEIQTIFWLPNYIGLGTLGIFLLIILGFYLKYKKIPLIS